MTKETTPTVQNAELSKITIGLQSFEERKEELQALAESAKSIKINGLDDKKAYAAVRNKRIELRNAEILIEKEAKAMRDLVTPISRHISAKEKELLNITSEEKERLIAEEKWFEDETEKIKAVKEAEERARIQKRIDALAVYGVAIDYNTVLSYTDNVFSEYLEAAKRQYEEEQKRIAIEKAQQEQLEKERQAKIESERFELEKIRIEQERIRKEQEKKEAEIKAEQERIDKERAKIEQAKKYEADRIQKEIETEKARALAAEQAIKSEQERVEKQRIEEERRISLMPDKEKLLAFSQELEGIIPNFQLKDDAAQNILDQVEVKIIEIQKYIIDSVDGLQ